MSKKHDETYSILNIALMLITGLIMVPFEFFAVGDWVGTVNAGAGGAILTLILVFRICSWRSREVEEGDRFFGQRWGVSEVAKIASRSIRVMVIGFGVMTFVGLIDPSLRYFNSLSPILVFAPIGFWLHGVERWSVDAGKPKGERSVHA